MSLVTQLTMMATNKRGKRERSETHAASRVDCRKTAGCIAVSPVKSLIWCRQENPDATTGVPGALASDGREQPTFADLP